MADPQNLEFDGGRRVADDDDLAHETTENHAVVDDEEEDDGRLSHFANADRLEKFDREIARIIEDVRAMSNEYLAKHVNEPVEKLQLKLNDPAYRRRRLDQFVSRVLKEVDTGEFVPLESVVPIAGVMFDSLWNEIGALADVEPEKPTPTRFLGVAPLPKKRVEEYDRKLHGDAIEFTKKHYGQWLDAELLDFESFRSLDPDLAKKVQNRLTYLEMSRSDLFTPSAIARENRELFERGELSEAAIARRIGRVAKHKHPRDESTAE
ncbi:MAG: hypothetical protein QNJ15_14260 [Erythrobacter sp.]|nr:hypothetical protein [Erythrobacter sp.]